VRCSGKTEHPGSWGGHTLPREQLSPWGGRVAETDREGGTVVSQPPTTPGGCSFATGVRWYTRNRHFHSTAAPDIPRDGIGIHLTFSGLVQ